MVQFCEFTSTCQVLSEGLIKLISLNHLSACSFLTALPKWNIIT